MLVPDSHVAVFGYGSLVSRRSISRTLGMRLPDPLPASLLGYRPGWVVGTETGYITDRHWTSVEGLPFRGVIGSLGLLGASGGSCPGAVHLIPVAALGLLHARERDYEPVFREALVHGEQVEVVTYLQKQRAEDVLRAAVGSGRAVITQEYLDIITGAFAGLGDDHLAAYRTAAPQPPCPVVRLIFHEGPAPSEG